MRYLILLSLFISISSQAQTLKGEEILLKENEELAKMIAARKESIEHYTKYIPEEKIRLANYQEQQIKLKDLVQNHAEVKSKLSAEVKTAYQKLSLMDKSFSRQAELYRCLDDFLKSQGSINVSECRRLNPIKLSSEEDAQLKSWDESLGSTKEQLSGKLEEVGKRIQKSRETLESFEKSLATTSSFMPQLEEKLLRGKIFEKDYIALKEKSNFRSCNATSPTINLEEERPYEGAEFVGPFHGVPRDNQDGLGTCYANTARNLLVGMSGGQADPSFLDMALTHKSAQDAIGKEGLDGGQSCGALSDIKKRGYCPQNLAPLESGEKNHAFESLLGKKNRDSVVIQSLTLELLKDFIQSKDELAQGNQLLDAGMMIKAQWMIEQMKANPGIKLPLPVARFDIPAAWKLREFHYGKQNEIGLSEEDFIREYRTAYKKFYPVYMKSVVQHKSREQIFEMFKTEMAPFIEKYKIQGSLDSWKIVFFNETEDDFKDPKYKKSVKNSLKFLKTLTGKDLQSDEAFISDCANDLGPGLNFLAKLQPLISKLKEMKVDPKLLFDKNGNFHNAQDLMQLAVAPACINIENRKPVPYEFTCDEGSEFIYKIKSMQLTEEERVQTIRDRVLMSLMNGYPLGNTKIVGVGSGHINTITGLRFNPEKNGCEYLIRESQTGMSTWRPETEIIQNIHGLTEVRKL